MSAESDVLSEMGVIDNGSGGYQYADNSQQSFTSQQQEDVIYQSVFGAPSFGDARSFATSMGDDYSMGVFDDLWNNPMGEVTSGSAEAPEEQSIGKTITDWAKDNEFLAKAGLLGGAGLLKSLSQQQMLEDQRDFIEKQSKSEWDRKMKASRYAKHTPQMSGLLDQAIKQRQGA